MFFILAALKAILTIMKKFNASQVVKLEEKNEIARTLFEPLNKQFGRTR